MKSPNGIKAILYDLDGTLRYNLPSGRAFFIEHLNTLGLEITAEDTRRSGVWEHRYWAESGEMFRDHDDYPSPDTFWTNYARRQLEWLGCPAEQARALAPEMRQYMSEAYHPQDVLLPGVESALRELSAGGYLLGVVSNREQPFGDYLVNKGLDKHVAFSLSGGEANSKKPDKGIFEHALRLADVCAEETIFVGDNYFADVVGARAAGIQPVLFDPERLFDEPDCPVICSHAELSKLLIGRNTWPGNRK